VADYGVRVKASAQKELEKLETHILERILVRIEALSQEPRRAGVKKLKGFRELWRLRVGDHRIVYAIDDKRE
jgi:mRNA interferase RelE/StbE